jgi:glycosyltransferase involved in cell wall biosynthesis
LFLVSEDWYFCSHRLPLALAAREAGFDVCVVTQVDRERERIEALGLRLIPIRLSRKGTNPLRDLWLIGKLTGIYRRERPDLVHQVALKPVLYGSLAARLSGVPGILNAMAGLGFLFSSRSLKARLLQPLVRLGLRLLLGGRQGHVIVQNRDDAAALTEMAHLRPGQVHLIPGSGVDLAAFVPAPEPPGPPVVMLPARLLWDKGVGEFAAAAERLGLEGTVARFVLVGAPDPGNPAAVPEAWLHEKVRHGILEWWGHSTDMAASLAMSHIVCLPSYREGMPKALLEAAACARPVVTSDAPGCRETVRHRETGLLVPVGDEQALASALRLLIRDAGLRLRYGQAARRLAEGEFGVEQVTRATLELYRALLRPATHPVP